jgi:aryl-alcohol dehydrogenase-like predicted oxidoreductase
METRQLGTSDLRITQIGFGSWALGGGGWEFAWGAQDDSDSIAAIRAAIDAGVNWIDTAAVYGLGHSEEVVAKAIDGVRPRPDIFTKCGLVWNDRGEIGRSLRAESIRRECEASLRRLRIDAIDLYQIHWPNPDEQIEEAWTTMARLQAEGKIRCLGVSNFSVDQMRRVQAIAPITSLQSPHSLLHREVEEDVLPFVARESIGFLAYSPLASGLLTGAMTRDRIDRLPADDWRRRSRDFMEPQLSRNLELAELLRAIGERHGRSPGEVAIAWVLHTPAVTGAIVGARNSKQVRGSFVAAELRLSAEDLGEIEAFLEPAAASRR